MIVFWLLVLLVVGLIALTITIAFGGKIYDTSEKVKSQFIYEDKKEDDK